MIALVKYAFTGGYIVVVGLFLACGLYLTAIAGLEMWRGMVMAEALVARFDAVLRGVGYLTIAVAALELGQTVLEEEVLRTTHVSGPTRVRRFLSRFLVVVVVSLAVESLIAVFHFAQDAPEQLPNAAAIAGAAALLLAAWGVFVSLNRAAEEIEPESLAATKREDAEVQAKERDAT
ncbi:MAG: hypothetical protein R2708_28295 [Vicinamibacterales bacterium]